MQATATLGTVAMHMFITAPTMGIWMPGARAEAGKIGKGPILDTGEK